MGLGSAIDVGLKEARDRASDCRRSLRDGIDPLKAKADRLIAARLEQAKAMSFDAVTADYLASHRGKWRGTKSEEQWINTLAAHVSPVFGKLLVKAIDTSLVVKACNRSGPRPQRQPFGYGGASRRSSILQRPAATAMARTRRVGAVISKICSRRPLSQPPSITPQCLMVISPRC
jgi:hypothetical protein